MGKKKRRRNHGNHKSRMRRKMLRQISPTIWLILGLLVLQWVLLAPNLQEFRDSLLFDILFRSALSVPYLYFAFLHKNHPPIFGQIAVVLTALTIWMLLVIQSRKTVMMLLLVLLYCDLGAALWYRIFHQRWYSVLCVAACQMALEIMATIGVLMNTIRGFPFWIPSLILAIGASWICFKLLWTSVVELEDDRLSERIAVVIGTFMVGFFLVWGSCMCVNYALDASKGKAYHTVLEDKTISTGKSTSYYLYVTVKGERISFEVGQSAYYQAEIGDIYVVEQYQGFLGEPYYTIQEEE